MFTILEGFQNYIAKQQDSIWQQITVDPQCNQHKEGSIEISQEAYNRDGTNAYMVLGTISYVIQASFKDAEKLKSLAHVQVDHTNVKYDTWFGIKLQLYKRIIAEPSQAVDIDNDLISCGASTLGYQPGQVESSQQEGQIQDQHVSNSQQIRLSLDACSEGVRQSENHDQVPNVAQAENAAPQFRDLPNLPLPPDRPPPRRTGHNRRPNPKMHMSPSIEDTVNSSNRSHRGN